MAADLLRQAAEAIRDVYESDDADDLDAIVFHLAVADWLDHEARLIEETNKARANDPGLRPVPQMRVDRSTAVAAAYLGRDA